MLFTKYKLCSAWCENAVLRSQGSECFFSSAPPKAPNVTRCNNTLLKNNMPKPNIQLNTNAFQNLSLSEICRFLSPRLENKQTNKQTKNTIAWQCINYYCFAYSRWQLSGGMEDCVYSFITAVLIQQLLLLHTFHQISIVLANEWMMLENDHSN